MRHAFLLAAAVALAACAGRAEDEAAAAPAPDVAGRPGDATVTPDSVLDDTTQFVSDSSSATGDSPISTPQDTLGPSVPDTSAQPDTTSWQ